MGRGQIGLGGSDIGTAAEQRGGKSGRHQRRGHGVQAVAGDGKAFRWPAQQNRQRIFCLQFLLLKRRQQRLLRRHIGAFLEQIGRGGVTGRDAPLHHAQYVL